MPPPPPRGYPFPQHHVTPSARAGVATRAKEERCIPRAPHCEPAGRARRRSRLVRQLAVVVMCGPLAGCMALRLSSRGAPKEEIRQFELQLEAVDLPVAHEEDSHEQHQPAPLWTTIPVSGWLHGFDYRLSDAEGHPVPREVLHHYKVMVPDRRELFSPLMLHLVGAGGETTPVSLPRQIGYQLEEGDSLLVTAMLHNPTGRSLEGVQLQITLHYSPPGSWQPPLRVVLFFTHVTPPLQETSYDLPRSSPSLRGVTKARGCHFWADALGDGNQAVLRWECARDSSRPVRLVPWAHAPVGPQLPGDGHLRQSHRRYHPRGRHGHSRRSDRSGGAVAGGGSPGSGIHMGTKS